MESLNLAIVGLGRIGALHALHARELAAETGCCSVTALVDTEAARAERLRRELDLSAAHVFASVEELAKSGAANAAVVGTPTSLHREHAEILLRSGCRVLLEKPMTTSLADDREFAAWVDREAPDGVMLAFQRRFDEPLRHAKRLLEEGAIGRPFKIVSVLEDSGPLPDGYVSSGILKDMSVHNVDEILWIMERTPQRAASLGANLYSHRMSTANEDFDDGIISLWFDDELVGQVQVSRNHVSGYRVETWIFGEEGVIHSGHFERTPFDVVVEAYGRTKTIARATYPMRNYGRPLPEFVDRFGPAYRRELEEFVDRCCSEAPFSVTHRDGVAAMEVIAAAERGALGPSVGQVVGE